MLCAKEEMDMEIGQGKQQQQKPVEMTYCVNAPWRLLEFHCLMLPSYPIHNESFAVYDT